MRSFQAVAIVLSILGAGVVGWFARGGCIATPPSDVPSPAGEPPPHSSPRLVDAYVESSPRKDAGAGDVRPADLAPQMDALAAEVGALRKEDSTRWASIASELEALKARIAEIAATQEALAKKAGVPLPWPSDPAEVEKVRDRWRSNLEDTEKRLRDAYPQGPDDRGDVIAWSRYDDHRKAKAAFEAATDSAALRALSEGVFRGYFTMPR